MDIEQPALGRIGVDAAQIALHWTWERGWTVATASRLSGASEWTRRSYGGLSDDEVPQLLQDVLSDWLQIL